MMQIFFIKRREKNSNTCVAMERMRDHGKLSQRIRKKARRTHTQFTYSHTQVKKERKEVAEFISSHRHIRTQDEEKKDFLSWFIN